MHRIKITIESKDKGAEETTNAIASIVQAHVPGRIEGMDGTPNSRAILLRVSEVVAKAELEPVTPAQVLLFGAKLYTDDEELRAICNVNSKAISYEYLNKCWPGISDAVGAAMNVLGNKDLPVDEIFVLDGKVRAMTSEKFGRRDSGWINLPEKE